MAKTNKTVTLNGKAPSYHTMPLISNSNKILYDGENGDITELTSNIAGLLGMYCYQHGIWLYYIPGFTTNTLLTLEYGEIYIVNVSACPQDWEVPDYVAPPPLSGEGIYTLSVYYAHVPNDGWPHDWLREVKYLVGYEARLLVDYIKQQGYAAELPIMSVELVELPKSYMSNYRIENLIRDLPSYQNTDIHVVVGSWSSGTQSFQSRGTVFMHSPTLQMQVYSMEGRGGIYDQIQCVLCHELGHCFHLQHCSIKPCPMSSLGVTYDEWTRMGRMIVFCGHHHDQLLENWQNRDYEH